MPSTNAGLATYGRPADTSYFSVALKSANPTIPTTADAALTGFETVRVSESGITPAIDLGKEDPVKDWARMDVLASPSSPSATLAVPIIDNSVAAKKLKYGSKNVGTNGSAVFDGTTDVWVVIVDELHNDADGEPKLLVRTIYPNCVPQQIEFGTHVKSELVIDTVTFQCLYDESIHGYWKELDPVAVSN